MSQPSGLAKRSVLSSFSSLERKLSDEQLEPRAGPPRRAGSDMRCEQQADD